MKEWIYAGVFLVQIFFSIGLSFAQDDDLPFFSGQTGSIPQDISNRDDTADNPFSIGPDDYWLERTSYFQLELELHQNITTALDLGLFEWDSKNVLVSTTLGLSVFTALAKQQALRSTLMSLLGRSVAPQVTFGATVLAVIMGTTYPYNGVRKSPWIFLDLPDEKKKEIVKDFPEVVETISNYSQDLADAIEVVRSDFDEDCYRKEAQKAERTHINLCTPDGSESTIELKVSQR